MGEKGVPAVGVGVGDDVGDGMHCPDHPYRPNPGGICAFCLQEKLSKLVSSSKSSSPFFPVPPPHHRHHSSSSSSSSPSFRSTAAMPKGLFLGGEGVGVSRDRPSSGSSAARSRIPFMYTANGHGKKGSGGGGRKVKSCAATTNGNGIVFNRSNSVAPRPKTGFNADGCKTNPSSAAAFHAMDTPRRRWFWSFLYLSSHNHHNHSSNGGGDRDFNNHHHHRQQQQSSKQFDLPSNISIRPAAAAAKETAMTPKRDHATVASVASEEAESPGGSQASSSFGRKVARSRSVGCGSRSFSGDFLERISTGLGDCALRRVESQREAKTSGSKIILHRASTSAADDEGRQGQQQRVRCGGIFGGFGMNSSSSSSSYWLSEELGNGSGRLPAISTSGGGGIDGGGSSKGTPHGRVKGWGWAFASPMRAFRPSSSKPYATEKDTPRSGTVSTASRGGGGAVSAAVAVR